MSRYVHFNESTAKPFQTKPLRHQDVRRVSMVVMAIKDNHLAQASWWAEPFKGSVTLRSDDHPGEVVKVFVDYGNRLAIKCGLDLHEAPIVVGFEITHQSAFVRECVRDELRKNFRYYVDPRVGDNSKWWLKPIEEHKYDILFLEEGPCPFEFDESQLEELQEAMIRDIEKHEAEDLENE